MPRTSNTISSAVGSSEGAAAAQLPSRQDVASSFGENDLEALLRTCIEHNLRPGEGSIRGPDLLRIQMPRSTVYLTLPECLRRLSQWRRRYIVRAWFIDQGGWRILAGTAEQFRGVELCLRRYPPPQIAMHQGRITQCRQRITDLEGRLTNQRAERAELTRALDRASGENLHRVDLLAVYREVSSWPDVAKVEIQVGATLPASLLFHGQALLPGSIMVEFLPALIRHPRESTACIAITTPIQFALSPDGVLFTGKTTLHPHVHGERFCLGAGGELIPSLILRGQWVMALDVLRRWRLSYNPDSPLNSTWSQAAWMGLLERVGAAGLSGIMVQDAETGEVESLRAIFSTALSATRMEEIYILGRMYGWLNPERDRGHLAFLRERVRTPPTPDAASSDDSRRSGIARAIRRFANEWTQIRPWRPNLGLRPTTADQLSSQAETYVPIVASPYRYFSPRGESRPGGSEECNCVECTANRESDRLRMENAQTAGGTTAPLVDDLAEEENEDDSGDDAIEEEEPDETG